MTIAEKLTQIAENEPKVFEAGYEKGKAEGGYTEGFNAGKQAEYDAFWDSYHDYGDYTNHDNCDFMFAGQGWNVNTIRPKKDIRPTRANMMFSLCGFKGDLAQHFEKLGILLDFSRCTMANSIFSNASQLTRLGILDFSKITSGTNWFINMSSLVTIDKLIVSDKTIAPGTYCFEACNKLENITIEGVIAKNGWSFQFCPKLSRASYESIRDHTTVMVPISITFSLKGVNKTYETSEGANDGSTSDEWVNLWKSMGNVTIALA